MRRLTGWTAALIAIALLVVMAGTGSVSRQATAATTQATMAATDMGTAQPDTSAEDNTPVSFIKAPSPDAGTIGISLGDSDKPIRLQTVKVDGPAGKAGLQIGDEIVEVNGKTATDRQTVVAAIVATKPDETIIFTVNRKGEKQDIKVTVSTRRDVYCPLPAPTGTAGKPVVKDPIIVDKNWAITQGGSEGVALTFIDGKLGFQNRGPGGRWAGLATLKGNRVPEFIYTVDVMQSSQVVSGLIFNYRSNDGFYLLQLIPNGSWTLSAIYNDGSKQGGLSFSDPALKAADANDPKSTTTNTITLQEENNNIYISFNGKFVCGTPLTQFGDPPIQRGGEGVFAVIYNDLPDKTVSFSNITLTEVVKK